VPFLLDVQIKVFWQLTILVMKSRHVNVFGKYQHNQYVIEVIRRSWYWKVLIELHAGKKCC
jgi:hypothetical protein